MKITGTYTVDAPRDLVWDALNDIEVLARIVPGCERLQQTGENEYHGTIKIGIQTIKGTYNGRIRIEDIQPPHHYRLVAHGTSANGVVDGSGTVDLAEQDGKTILTYAGDAQIGGALASVGQRLIEGASKQLINQSLKALVEQVNARKEGAAPAAPAPEQAAGGAPAGAEQAMPWPFPSSTHPRSLEPETPEPAPAAPAPEEAAGEESAPVEQAMPWPFPSPAQPSSSFEPRTVVVPDHEQLKSETILRGVVEDVLKERPWLPWVVAAFLLGYILGRMRR